MSAAAAYAALRTLRAPVVTTGEAAAALHVSDSSASRTLRTLTERGLLRRIRQGIWLVAPDAPPPGSIIGELTRPFPAYVSFQSALAMRGAIDQIPREITIASLGKPRRIRTTLGTYRVHHLPPALFGGSEERGGVALATAEKALFDSCYVACASGHPDRRLPELDLRASFSRAEVRRWTDARGRGGLARARARGIRGSCSSPSGGTQQRSPSRRTSSERSSGRRTSSSTKTSARRARMLRTRSRDASVSSPGPVKC